jgi:two-component system, NarL family, response regulator NreC
LAWSKGALENQEDGRIEGFEHNTGKANDMTLTDRELQVLRLICAGNMNKVVASKPHMSIRTVESHKANIRQKLLGNSSCSTGEALGVAAERAVLLCC